jgi:DNA-binding beta-propeller fold protein YncE
VAVDPASGAVYVVDTGNNRVEKLNAAGVYQSEFGSTGSGTGQFASSGEVAVDPSSGAVYVADSGNNRVERFGPLPRLTIALAGSGHGRVAGAGVACPGRCARAYAPGASTSLSATPVAGSAFTGWSGACGGTGACQLTMGAARAVTARFAKIVRATITKAKINAGKHKASFSFKASGAGGFQCALVKPATKAKPHFTGCHSPKAYKQLTPGKYSFRVRALFGRTKGPAAKRSFTI